MAILERTTEPWSALLDAGREDGRLVSEAREGPTDATLVELPAELHPDVRAALGAVGIERLYAHQAQALHAAWAGPTIVTTGTASGKSLCFNLPTLDVLCRDPKARALYLYPTKALAQDQARALNAFGLHERVRPAIYDGDTPREARRDIRRRANLVLSNPDMLHVGILPHHHAVGRAVGQPRGGGDRRGARLPRGVGLACGQRAAPPAAGGERLRHRAALSAGLGDDRQPGGAGAAAHRAWRRSR